MEAWFVSDIHLKSSEERNGQILLRFLHSLQKKDPQQVHLFLLGDIFDLWIGKHQYFANSFGPLTEALRTLRKSGMKITYIEGNHDVHVEGYFKKKLDIDVFVEAQHFHLNGLRVRLEHGDLINQHDEAYLKYRSIIRNPYIKPFANIIPGRLLSYLGRRASKKSRHQSSHFLVQNEDRLVKMIRQHAETVYNDVPFDVIISGHMHVFDDYSFVRGDHQARSFNLGSWFTEQVRVLRLEGQEFSWVTIA